MHKTIPIILLTVLLLNACHKDRSEYWISTYPLFYAGNTITEIGDTICFEYLPYPYDIYCSFYERKDSIFDSDNVLIGIKDKDRITIFNDDKKIYYTPYEPINIDVSYDSLLNLLIGNKWLINQGEFSYRLDFFDRFEQDTIGPFPCMRQKQNVNDSLLMPYDKWLTDWFLSYFAGSYILGINYALINNYQLFKILEIENSNIILESIYEYDKYLSKSDTNKTSGLLYNLVMFPKLSPNKINLARSFFSDNLNVINQVSDSIGLTARSRHIHMDCKTSDIKEILIGEDSLRILYKSGYWRKSYYKFDEWGDNIILSDGISIHDYLKYNLSDSTLTFYDRVPEGCHSKNRYFKVVKTTLKLEK